MRLTKLTSKDYNIFYKYNLFGNIRNNLESAIKRAYRDFNRTLSGFSKDTRHDIIFENASKYLYKEIINISKNISNQEEFDQWHKQCCKELINLFENQKLYYGQAQKWINMTLKYYSILDYESIKNIYEYCHVPIDKKILNKVNYQFSSAWSKIDNYDLYLDFQNWFRKTYKGIPLDVEFKLWLEAVND